MDKNIQKDTVPDILEPDPLRKKREYMRTVQGYKRGSRKQNFISKFPDWSILSSFLKNDADIIRLYYIDNQTDEAISKVLSIPRRTITERRTKAYSQLERLQTQINQNSKTAQSNDQANKS